MSIFVFKKANRPIYISLIILIRAVSVTEENLRHSPLKNNITCKLRFIEFYGINAYQKLPNLTGRVFSTGALAGKLQSTSPFLIRAALFGRSITLLSYGLFIGCFAGVAEVPPRFFFCLFADRGAFFLLVLGIERFDEWSGSIW